MNYLLNLSPMFAGVSDSDSEKMYNCLGAKKKTFSAGDVIFSCGDGTDFIGIIARGGATLQRTDMLGGKYVLDTLTGGDVFGEMAAFLNPMGDDVSITAKSECEVIFISRDRVTRPCGKVCECHTTMLRNLIGMISQRAMRLSERVEVISNRSIREKLRYFFLLEVKKQGGRTITLPFSASALADYICADRSAMMREMAAMKRDGLIDYERRRVTVL